MKFFDQPSELGRPEVDESIDTKPEVDIATGGVASEGVRKQIEEDNETGFPEFESGTDINGNPDKGIDQKKKK